MLLRLCAALAAIALFLVFEVPAAAQPDPESADRYVQRLREESSGAAATTLGSLRMLARLGIGTVEVGGALWIEGDRWARLGFLLAGYSHLALALCRLGDRDPDATWSLVTDLGFAMLGGGAAMMGAAVQCPEPCDHRGTYGLAGAGLILTGIGWGLADLVFPSADIADYAERYWRLPPDRRIAWVAASRRERRDVYFRRLWWGGAFTLAGSAAFAGAALFEQDVPEGPAAVAGLLGLLGVVYLVAAITRHHPDDVVPRLSGVGETS